MRIGKIKMRDEKQVKLHSDLKNHLEQVKLTEINKLNEKHAAEMEDKKLTIECMYGMSLSNQ